MRDGICKFCIVAPDDRVVAKLSFIAVVVLVCCWSFDVGMHFFVVRMQGLTSATELTQTTTNPGFSGFETLISKNRMDKVNFYFSKLTDGGQL